MFGLSLPPFFAAVVVVGLLVMLGLHLRTRLTTRAFRLAAGALIAIAALQAILVASRVAMPREPLAHVEVIAGQTVSLPASDRPVSLLVRGALPHVSGNESATAHYDLTVAEAGESIHLKGTFEEHWAQSRARRRGPSTRSLVVHTEDRHDLALEPGPDALSLHVDELEGQMVGPLVVEEVPAPPSHGLVFGIATGLTVLAAGLDVFERKRSSMLVAAVGTLAAFGDLLLRNVTPHGSGMTVFGAGMAAALFGGGGGLLLRVLLRSFLLR